MSTSSAPAREQWADAAKGACIVLVVLWHVTRKDYLQLPWSLDAPVPAAWGTLSEALLPVRMPLFFVVSGWFAARWLRRPWREVWSVRVAPLLYLFVLWTLLHTAALQLTPGFDTAIADSPTDLLVQLSITPGNLWYLLALAAYVVVARLTRAAPRWALAIALVLSTAAYAGLLPTPGNRAGLLANLVWFLLGTQAQAWGVPLGRRARARTVVAIVLGLLAAAAAWQVLDADAWFGVRPALGVLGIAAGAVVAPRLVQVPHLGPALAALGRRTLPVYVLHLPLVALVHVGSQRVVPGGSLAVAALYPVVMSAAVLGACLLLHRLLVGCGGWWLFAAPWAVRRLPRMSGEACARRTKPHPGSAGVTPPHQAPAPSDRPRPGRARRPGRP